jgi:hypothetical protein
MVSSPREELFFASEFRLCRPGFFACRVLVVGNLTEGRNEATRLKENQRIMRRMPLQFFTEIIYSYGVAVMIEENGGLRTPRQIRAMVISKSIFDSVYIDVLLLD